MKRLVIAMLIALALVFIISCSDSAVAVTSAEKSFPVPVFLTEPDDGLESRYIATTITGYDAAYYMLSPMFKGFEIMQHDFSKGNLEIETSILGKKITKTVSMDMKGDIICRVSDIDNSSFEFTMEYNIKTMSFSYTQALLYKTQRNDGNFEHVMFLSFGNDIRVDWNGDYRGKVHAIGAQNMSGSTLLIESDAVLIGSNKDYSASLLKGSMVQYGMDCNYSSNPEIWLQEGKKASYDDILSRLNIIKADGVNLGTATGYELRLYDKSRKEFSYIRNEDSSAVDTVSIKLDQIDMAYFKDMK